MARETVQQKRDREFMTLLDAQLRDQRIELGVQAAREKSKAREESHLIGWHDGYNVAVREFARLSWWERLMWRAER
jgi:hypothetical protein